MLLVGSSVASPHPGCKFWLQRAWFNQGLSQQCGFQPLSQTLSNHFCRGAGLFFDEVPEIRGFGTSSNDHPQSKFDSDPIFPYDTRTIQLALTCMKSLFKSLLLLAALPTFSAAPGPASNQAWEPIGLSGGGAMFSPAISPVNPDLMMLNCDMGAAYISQDGGRNWRMIHHAQLRSDTQCRPAFHPRNPEIIYASSGGRLRISRDRGKTFQPIGNLKETLYGQIAINPAAPEIMLVGTRTGRCAVSRDSGSTWSTCNGPTGRLLGVHFDRIAQGRVLFAATEQGVWRSDDAGDSWALKTNGLPSKKIQGFAGGSNPNGRLSILYCSLPSELANGACTGGIFLSRNLGESWRSAMGEGINKDTAKADQYARGPVAQYQQLLTTDANPSTVYAFNRSTGFHPPHHETVYRSDDAGQHWRATYFQDPRFTGCNVALDYMTASTGQSFKGGETPFGVAICNSDPERVLLVINECHITHDGGKSWFTGHTYPATAERPGPGSSWICNGLVVTTTWNFYIDPFQPNRQYIAYTDIGFARSVDAGKSWIWWDKKSWAPWRNTCYELAFDPAIPGTIWGAFSNVHDIPNDNIISERHGHNGPGGICVSRDFGASWKVEARGLPSKATTSIVIDPTSPKEARRLYAGIFSEGVYKSIDSGRMWVQKNRGLGHPENMRVSRLIRHNDGTLFAMVCARRAGPGKPLLPEGVGLYRSRDGADKWEKVNATKLFLYPKDFSIDPRDSQRIVLGTCDAGGPDQSGGLYRTQDGGQTWQRIGREGPQTFGGYFHPKYRSFIYMTLTEGAPHGGLWLTRDDGKTWEPFNDLPFSNIQRVTFDPADESKIYVTTFGGSVWHGPAVP